jgi:hypothetical protein
VSVSPFPKNFGILIRVLSVVPFGWFYNLSFDMPDLPDLLLLRSPFEIFFRDSLLFKSKFKFLLLRLKLEWLGISINPVYTSS